MYTRTRLTPEQRTSLILHNAYEVAEEVGLHSLSIKNVSEKMNDNTSKTTIRHYFGNLSNLRKAVAEKAVEHNNEKLIEQARVLEIL